MRKITLVSILVLLIGSVLAACEQRTPQTETPTAMQAPSREESQQAPADTSSAETMMEARARLQPTEGNRVTGTVVFRQEPDGVRIIAELEGFSGAGRHGFHVHEKGDCSAPDAASAGGHYNPQGTPHGSPDDPPDQRHAGDFGNIEADEDGRARYDRLDPLLQLTGPESIIGRAVLVHADPDDLTSQPAGDSGDRVACGIIEEVPSR